MDKIILYYYDPYTYAFQQMQRDNGTKSGNDLPGYATLFRGYDTEGGRWNQIDPKWRSLPSESPYCGMGNNPVNIIDPLGDSVFTYGDRNQNLIDDLNAWQRMPGKNGALQFSLAPTRDEQSFRVISSRVEGRTLDASDIAFENILEDSDVNVDVLTFSFAQQGLIGAGEDAVIERIGLGLYMGNYTSLNGTTVKEAITAISFDQVAQINNTGMIQEGEVSAHEIFETFISARYGISQVNAHNQALIYVPRTIGYEEKLKPNQPNIKQVWIWRLSDPDVKRLVREYNWREENVRTYDNLQPFLDHFRLR